MRLQLSLATAANPRSWPILDGTVKPDGIDLITTVIHPSEIFWRQLKFQDFDISETGLKDRPARGHISFQDEGKRVWYRNVRIRELDSRKD